MFRCSGCRFERERDTAPTILCAQEMCPGVRGAPRPDPIPIATWTNRGSSERLVDFSDERRWPMSPSACPTSIVWPVSGCSKTPPVRGNCSSRVHFARREVAISLDPRKVRLSEVAALLSSLRYPPDLTLAGSRVSARVVPRRALAVACDRSRWIRLRGNQQHNAVQPARAYFGLDSAAGGCSNVGGLAEPGVVASPVVGFSAIWDFWRTAWNSVRVRKMTMDVPIAVGIAALFLQSVVEIVSGRGEGYFDSLAGLVFSSQVAGSSSRRHDRPPSTVTMRPSSRFRCRLSASDPTSESAVHRGACCPGAIGGG